MYSLDQRIQRLEHSYVNNSGHRTPKRWATRNNRSFQCLCNEPFIKLCVICASNLIAAAILAFELIVQVIAIVRSSRVDMHYSSRIRFIFGIVGLSDCNFLEMKLRNDANDLTPTMQMKEKGVKRNKGKKETWIEIIIFGCRWSRIDDIKFTSCVYAISFIRSCGTRKRLSIFFLSAVFVFVAEAIIIDKW